MNEAERRKRYKILFKLIRDCKNSLHEKKGVDKTPKPSNIESEAQNDKWER